MACVGRQGEHRLQRLEATCERIERFLHRLGQVFRGSGRLYLVGGSLMVFQGYRPVTQDLDYTVQLVAGDDQDFTSAVRQVQREINLNIVRASPGDFIPLPRGWQERSPFLGRYGHLEVFAFDPLTTALSKIERGLERDVTDALALQQAGQFTLAELTAAFEEIVPRLEREAIPRVQEGDFRRKLAAFINLALSSDTARITEQSVQQEQVDNP
jgi:hypothetical protein